MIFQFNTNVTKSFKFTLMKIITMIFQFMMIFSNLIQMVGNSKKLQIHFDNFETKTANFSNFRKKLFQF